jgi:hypothetical protein
MLTTDDILKIASANEFEQAARQVFARQAAVCPPYRDYLSAVGVDSAEVERIAASGTIEQIPFLPIELFKSHKVYCDDEPAPEAVFTSSSTTGTGLSHHYVARLADYEKTFTRGFELFYGSAADWNIRSLLPCYEERKGSSLIYMVEGLRRMGSGEGGRPMLFGVSYALLDLAEECTARRQYLPPEVIVVETGGMKGRREEISKARMHSILQSAFGLPAIHSEYGMAELMSQAWSSGEGIFTTPPWMRVLVRDVSDPFDVKVAGRGDSDGGGHGDARIRGGINIIDLANLHSCAFIQTQDRGTLAADGSFTIEGRIARSDIRGCNLLVQ